MDYNSFKILLSKVKKVFQKNSLTHNISYLQHGHLVTTYSAVSRGNSSRLFLFNGC